MSTKIITVLSITQEILPAGFHKTPANYTQVKIYHIMSKRSRNRSRKVTFPITYTI